MDEPTSLFVSDGDGFLPTGLTRTGWEDDAQHGGPPAGLLAHVLEADAPELPMRIVRLNVDLMRRVPLERITATIRPVREGRRIRVIDAELRSGGETVARATALWIRTTSLDFPDLPADGRKLPESPETLPVLEHLPWEGGDPSLLRFHRHAVEVRTIGESFWRPGRGMSWLKLNYPVVAGTPLSPFVRAATLADVGNGNARMLDPTSWFFINPDVNLSLHRPPEGEWLGMSSLASQHPDGVGMADTLLFDTTGPVGRVIQSQILMAR